MRSLPPSGHCLVSQPRGARRRCGPGGDARARQLHAGERGTCAAPSPCGANLSADCTSGARPRSGAGRREGSGAIGRVAEARFLRSIPLLDQAALDAIRQWRFTASPDKSTKVTVTVRFVSHQIPLLSAPGDVPPRPPVVDSRKLRLRLRVPACRRATEEIDSITRVVTNTKDRGAPAQRFSFDFEGEQAAEVFLALVGAGFFDAGREEGGRTWKEVPRVEAGISHTGDQIFVTVPADTPVVDVGEMSTRIQWFGGNQPEPRVHHVLRVRRADQWKEFPGTSRSTRSARRANRRSPSQAGKSGRS